MKYKLKDFFMYVSYCSNLTLNILFFSKWMNEIRFDLLVPLF